MSPSSTSSHSRTLAWVTDIHLDFLSSQGISRFCEEIDSTGADAVLIGGDISQADQLEDHLQQMAEELKRPTYFVLGNHDFYRGSVESVTASMSTLSERSPWLSWLPARGVLSLTPRTGLLGCDGWGDARLGDFERTDVFLNDFLLIEDLAQPTKEDLRRVLMALGDRWGDFVRATLPAAAATFPHILFLTHVPPFKEACWFEGRISNDSWLPFFTCAAVGEALKAVALAQPDCHITVLCGHTHGGGFARILPNLEVHTGAAQYGAPTVQRLITVD